MSINTKNKFLLSTLKTTLFLSLFLLIGCKKEQVKVVSETRNSVSAVSSVSVRLKSEKVIRTDTIKLLENDEVREADFVLAQLLQTKLDKDSLVTAYFRLDFYTKNQKVQSDNLMLHNFQEGSEWSGFYGLKQEESVVSPFIQISFGYPACGYNQDHFLYYKNNSKFEQVFKWSSSSDSGWGSWTDFSASKKDLSTIFYSHTVSFSPQDDNEDSGILSLSDSIKFERKNNKWIKKWMTPKDFVYSKKKQSFDAFHAVAN